MSHLLLAIATAAIAASDPADAIVGKWYTGAKESIVEISRGDNERYYGRIIWLTEPLVEEGHPEAGQPKRDINNPDKEKQDAPIIGLVILKDFEYNARKARWDSGTIYDPHDGKSYNCSLQHEMERGTEVLNVRGYVGIRLIGRTTKWTRVPESEDPAHPDS